MSSATINLNTKSIVTDHGGNAFTQVIAMGYRKFVWKENDLPLCESANQNRFFNEVTKAEKIIAQVTLGVTVGATIGLLASQSFFVFLAVSPALIALTALAIYTLKHAYQRTPLLQEDQSVNVDNAYLFQPSDQQVADFTDFVEHLAQQNIAHVPGYSFEDVAQFNQQTAFRHWTNATFVAILEQFHTIPENVIPHYLDAVYAQSGAFFQQKSLVELSITTLDFKCLPRPLQFVEAQYKQAISINYDASEANGYPKTIDLSSPGLSAPIESLFLDTLLEKIDQNEDRTILNLAGRQIDDAQLTQIAAHLNKIEFLRMDCTNLSDDAIHFLFFKALTPLCDSGDSYPRVIILDGIPPTKRNLYVVPSFTVVHNFPALQYSWAKPNQRRHS